MQLKSKEPLPPPFVDEGTISYFNHFARRMKLVGRSLTSLQIAEAALMRAEEGKGDARVPLGNIIYVTGIEERNLQQAIKKLEIIREKCKRYLRKK